MIQHSESIQKLAAALVKANAEVQHAVKDSKNPHFRSDYASLTSVIDTVKPVYAAHGLTFSQWPGMQDGLATLSTILVHDSGEWMTGTSASPLQKNDPQGVGSALTYLRRYSLAALAGIAQEDDDGNAASAPRQAKAQPKPAKNGKTKETGELASEKQVAFIEKLSGSHVLTEKERDGIRSRLLNGMTKQQASDAIEWLTTTIEDRKDEGAPVEQPA